MEPRSDEAGPMFDPDLAETIADGMRAEGKRPSVRTVRQALVGLGKGGSPRRVADFLTDWRKRHGLSEFEADTGVAPDFQTRIDFVTGAIWREALERADARFAEERAELRAARDRLADELEEAERRIRSLEAERLSRLEGEANLHQRRRAEEFWDRVMRAVKTLLEREGRAMAAVDILLRLSDDLSRESSYHAEKLDLSTLNKKLKERHKWSRYVRSVQHGDDVLWEHRVPEARASRRRAAANQQPSP